MDLPSFIDEDVVYSLTFWMLTLGTLVAFLIGFKLSTAFGVVGSEAEYEIPLMIRLVLLLLTPIIAYIITGRFR